MRYSSMDHLRPNGWVTRADAADASFAWNQRTAHFVSSATTDSWSHICSGPYGGLAGHIAKRSFITGDKESCIGNLGRPQHPQESKLEIYCRYQRVGHLEKITHKYEQWEQHLCSIPNYRIFAAHAHGAFVSSLALTTFKNWVVTFGIRTSWTNHFHGVWVWTTLQKKGADSLPLIGTVLGDGRFTVEHSQVLRGLLIFTMNDFLRSSQHVLLGVVERTRPIIYDEIGIRRFWNGRCWDLKRDAVLPVLLQKKITDIRKCTGLKKKWCFVFFVVVCWNVVRHSLFFPISNCFQTRCPIYKTFHRIRRHKLQQKTAAQNRSTLFVPGLLNNSRALCNWMAALRTQFASLPFLRRSLEGLWVENMKNT